MRSFVPKPRSLSLTSGFPESSLELGISDLGLLRSATLKDAQHVSGLGDLPSFRAAEVPEEPLSCAFPRPWEAGQLIKRCGSPSWE